MAYPAHVTEGFGSLASYLLSPPSSHELSSGGGLTPAAQAKIEKLVHSEIEYRIAGFRIPESLSEDAGQAHIWAIISSMQKAIRFRDRENAMFAANIGWAKDPGRVFRRLGVISLEDTGAGSLFGIMMALASLGNRLWRNRVGDRRLAVWLADQLAMAPKDRSLCELLVLANYGNGPDKQAMSCRSNAELIGGAIDGRLPLAERMLAAWQLSGAHKFHGIMLPRVVSRTPSQLIQVMVEAALPRALIYIAHKAVSRLGEDLYVGLMFMHEMLSATDKVVLHEPPTFESEKVGALLGAAYDMHTREGLTSLRLFAREVAEVRTFVDMVPRAERRRMIGFGVFLAEGARLGAKLNYAGADLLTADAHRAELNSPRLPEECHGQFLTAIADNAGELRAYRVRTLGHSGQNTVAQSIARP